MKTNNRLLAIFGVLFVFCFVVSCISSKSKGVTADKIFDYYPKSYISKNGFNWIHDNNIKITTLKYAYPVSGLVLYAQKIDEVSIAGRELVIYFKPCRSDFDPTQNKMMIIGYVFNYQTGFKNRTFVTTNWIDCPYVCNDKKLKDFLNNVF